MELYVSGGMSRQEWSRTHRVLQLNGWTDENPMRTRKYKQTGKKILLIVCFLGEGLGEG